MKHSSQFTRCEWLHTAAATAGSLLLPGRMALTAALSDVAETEHFWYRLAPDGPCIDSQRDHKACGFGGGKIFLSEDNGTTWPHRAEFAEAENITFNCLLKNGNILFATRAKLFLSTDHLKTHRAITVMDREGRDYLPQTPVNPTEPDW